MAKTFDLSVLFRIIDKATGPLRKIGNQFRGLTQKVKAFGTRMGAVGKQMQATGRSMSMRMTLPIVGLGVAAIHTASGFQKSMNMVQGITNATGEEFKELSDLAMELGKTTVFSSRDAADAMKFLARTGMDVKTIMGALPTVLKLAAAGQMDLAVSADIVTNVMKGFGAQEEELEEYSDILAKTFTSANVDLTMLGESFKYAGPVAKSAGMEFKELAAILGALGDAGIQGSMAGTTVRQALIKLNKPSQKATQIMGRMGVKIFDSTGKMRKMSTILSDLSAKNINLAEASEIFGVRAVSGMMRIMKDGIPALIELEKKLGNAKGTADRLEKATMKGLPGAMARLKAATEAMLISFTREGGLADAFMSVSKRIVDLMDAFSKLSPETKKWITVGLGVAAVLGPIIMALGFLASGISAIIAIAPALGAAATIAFGPWGIAIAAFIVAIYLIVKHWKAIKNTLTTIANNFIEIINSMLRKLSEIPLLGKLFKGVKIGYIGGPAEEVRREIAGKGAYFRPGEAMAMKSENKIQLEIIGRGDIESKVTGVKKVKGDADVEVISQVWAGAYGM